MSSCRGRKVNIRVRQTDACPRQNTAEILGSTRLLPSMERKVNELVVSQEASDKGNPDLNLI